MGANLLIGALLAGLVVAFGIGAVTRTGTVREDTAIGIFFAGALALGVVLISTMDTYAVDLTHVLFGNVLGVTATDLWISGLLALLVLGSILALYRQLLVVSFDPILGRTLGLRTHALRSGLFILLAVTIVVSLRTVGGGACRGHAGDPARRRVPGDAQAPGHDGGVRGDRAGLRGRRSLRQLLPRCGHQRGRWFWWRQASSSSCSCSLPVRGVVWRMRRRRSPVPG